MLAFVSYVLSTYSKETHGEDSEEVFVEQQGYHIRGYWIQIVQGDIKTKLTCIPAKSYS